jgi:hypothetical protein
MPENAGSAAARVPLRTRDSGATTGGRGGGIHCHNAQIWRQNQNGKKKKKTKGGQCSSSTNAEDGNSELSREATTNDPKKEEEMPSVVLKTLPDGKTAVQVKGRQDHDVMEKGDIFDVMEKGDIFFGGGGGLNPDVQSQDASTMLAA